MSSHSKRRGWRARGGGGHGKGNDGYHGSSKRPHKDDAEVDESSPVIKAFRGFQEEMDAKNDRFERIMKLNRDITIESKRLIFLLQRVSGLEDSSTVLAEAEDKMKELHTTKFVALAKELQGQDIHQFLKAFTGGLQEYIEAVTFYHYLVSKKLAGVNTIQSELVFKVNKSEGKHNTATTNTSVQSTIEKMTDLATSDPERFQDSAATQSNSKETQMLKEDVKDSSSNVCDSTTDGIEDSASSQVVEELRVPIPPTEYMLGVADFTGELMRMAINSVGSGDLETPRVIADMMRVIHDAFSTFSNTPREMRRKTNVLRQSLAKVERACYTLQVRGSEIPKHMLADVFTGASNLPGENSFMPEDADDLFD